MKFYTFYKPDTGVITGRMMVSDPTVPPRTKPDEKVIEGFYSSEYLIKDGVPVKVSASPPVYD